MTTLGAIRCVWLRYFDVYRKSLKYAIVTTFVEPLLYVFAFGFGLGPMIGTVNVAGLELTYRQFIFAGIVSQTLMFQGFFEAAYGAFIRMYYQRIFQAIAVTPITLSEVLWAELIWDASKAAFAAIAVLAIGVVLGDFSLPGALLAIPFCFAGGSDLRSAWPAGGSKVQDNRGDFLSSVSTGLSDVPVLRRVLSTGQSAGVPAGDRLDFAAHLRGLADSNANARNTP